MCRELVKRIRVLTTTTYSTTQEDLSGRGVARSMILTSPQGEVDTPRNVVIRAFCGSVQAELAQLRQSMAFSFATRPENSTEITATAYKLGPVEIPAGSRTGTSSSMNLADATNTHVNCFDYDYIGKENRDTSIRAADLNIANSSPTSEGTPFHPPSRSLAQPLSVESTMMHVAAMIGRPDVSQFDSYASPECAYPADINASGNNINNCTFDSNRKFLSQDSLLPSGPCTESQDASPTTSTDSSNSKLPSYDMGTEAHETSESSGRGTVHKQTDPLPFSPAVVVTDRGDPSLKLHG